jgi:hypothetical protein
MKFEYKVIKGEISTDTMNKLGVDGWELVSVIHSRHNSFDNYYYFKRALPTN